MIDSKRSWINCFYLKHQMLLLDLKDTQNYDSLISSFFKIKESLFLAYYNEHKLNQVYDRIYQIISSPSTIMYNSIEATGSNFLFLIRC